MKINKRLLQRPIFIRLLHWEYWNFHVVYAPIYIYWIWLCIKSRSLFFFNTANPSIKNGGFLMESKKAIYDLVPEEYYPATLFFNAGTSIEEITMQLQGSQLKFPLIGKPDMGMRGMSVQKLESIAEVEAYSKASRVDFLLQTYVDFKNEVGIFYYRYPTDRNGQVSGIVSKEFLIVVGDGVSTIDALLRKDNRFILQIPVLQKTYGDKLKIVLQNNEEYLLVPYGNHCRGAKFIDASNLIDEQLTHVIDRVCKQVKGFYFGRLDIRYNTWEELRAGKFSIIELNGAGSEPAHIYDPKHSIFFAWREIVRHLDILYKISRMNHQFKKMPYMELRKGLAMFNENASYTRMITDQIKLRA
jgi:hypothetical protein